MVCRTLTYVIFIRHLLELVKNREKTKRDLLKITVDIFKKRLVKLFEVNFSQLIFCVRNRLIDIRYSDVMRF